MTRQRWDGKTKAALVLDGFKGKPVATICTEYRISQAQYYQWRGQFVSNAPKLFEVVQQTDREAQLQKENSRLKKLVVELTLKLKESDDEEWW